LMEATTILRIFLLLTSAKKKGASIDLPAPFFLGCQNSCFGCPLFCWYLNLIQRLIFLFFSFGHSAAYITVSALA